MSSNAMASIQGRLAYLEPVIARSQTLHWLQLILFEISALRWLGLGVLAHETLIDQLLASGAKLEMCLVEP